MPFGKLLILYVLTAVVFLAIDLFWLGYLASDIYRRHLGHLMRENVNWTAALIFYAMFIIGILFFCVWPAWQQGNLWYALGAGALFGLLTYATYDLTNLATLKAWPTAIVWIDIPWGMVLATLTSGAGYLLARWLFPAG